MLGPSDSAIANTFTKKTEKSITKAMYAHYSKILFHIVINPMISVLIISLCISDDRHNL